MQVTVTAPYKKAVFTWSEDLEDCSVVAHGFEDDEFDASIEAGAHEGADVDGYEVSIH